MTELDFQTWLKCQDYVSEGSHWRAPNGYLGDIYKTADGSFFVGPAAEINPEWEKAEWGIEPPDFTCHNTGPIPEHGPDTTGPDVGSADPSN